MLPELPQIRGGSRAEQRQAIDPCSMAEVVVPFRPHTRMLGLWLQVNFDPEETRVGNQEVEGSCPTAKASRWMIWVIAPKQARSGDTGAATSCKGPDSGSQRRHEGRVIPVDSMVEPSWPSCCLLLASFSRVLWLLRCRLERVHQTGSGLVRWWLNSSVAPAVYRSHSRGVDNLATLPAHASPSTDSGRCVCEKYLPFCLDTSIQMTARIQYPTGLHRYWVPYATFFPLAMHLPTSTATAKLRWKLWVKVPP